MSAEPPRQPKERLSCRTLPSVISIARSAKRAEELMRMRLKNQSTRAHNLSPLAALIAWSAHLVERIPCDKIGGRGDG
ncbi:MAG: hypothetical protein J2P36_09620 [Ktedonobacteraceae bacterium]|nr:hypothetical protein [Ktedonobacteraceae bacterium]